MKLLVVTIAKSFDHSQVNLDCW